MLYLIVSDFIIRDMYYNIYDIIGYTFVNLLYTLVIDNDHHNVLIFKSLLYFLYFYFIFINI